MIGTLKHGEFILTLGDDLKWSCPDDPIIADAYNATFTEAELYSGPQDGHPGSRVFLRTAQIIGAEILDGPNVPESTEAGRLY